MRIVISFVFVLIAVTKSSAQDEFQFFFSADVGIIQAEAIGPFDNTGYEKINYQNNPYPVYTFESKKYYSLHETVSGNLNIPFYKNDKWSTGTKISLGLGYSMSLSGPDVELYEGLLIAFPEYLYYRNYQTAVDISFLLGYKYVITSLPYSVPMAAIEFTFSDCSLRLYGSLYPKKYYIQYSDGSFQESLIVNEFGVTWCLLY